MEVVLIHVEEAGPCGICGIRSTWTWCTTCTPQHYVCSGCHESHKTSLQKEKTQ